MNKNFDNEFNSQILRDYFNNFFINKNYDSVIDNFSTIKGIHNSLAKQKFMYDFLAICLWILCAILLIVVMPGVTIVELVKNNKKMLFS
ncbi:hypothetical protein [Spiroplasma endosymbiont of Labia minor]|uniref:hypothetical protein n=1 Tax=Spiroplasma endosymbiont of Labia minor TaxID=3066305 RepID=UPI0030CB6828